MRRAVEELGYVPNHAARTLVTRRNGAVAVIIAEPEFRIFSDPFFEQQVRGISRELTAHDSQLVLLWVEGPGTTSGSPAISAGATSTARSRSRCTATTPCRP